MQTIEEVTGLLFDWTTLLDMHLSGVYHGEQLQNGSLSWAGCYHFWSSGMSKPGSVFHCYAYAAVQQLAQVLTRPCI